jgi:ligand-binding sensor domain-containing protein
LKNTSLIFLFASLLILAACSQPGKKVTALSPFIQCIFQDKQHNYWFGSDRDGLYKYDGKSLMQYTEADGLPHPQIRTIQQDINGNVWIVTGYGICYYNGTEFIPFVDDEQRRDSLKVTKWPISDNDIYLQAGSGVYCFNGKNFGYWSIVAPANLNFIKGGGLMSNTTVYCTLRSKKQKLYVGTQAIGVVVCDAKSMEYISTDSSSKLVVRCILEDKKGNIWYGTNGGGLMIFDGKQLRNITKELKLDDSDTIHNLELKPNLKRIWSIAEDEQSNIWIGSNESGLWKYDGNNIIHFGDKEGINSQSIHCIYKDQTNKLWLGTSNGTYTFDGTKFELFRIP